MLTIIVVVVNVSPITQEGIKLCIKPIQTFLLGISNK